MILVATDGSKQAQAAIRTALDLASELAEDVVFVTAWRELRTGLGVPLSVVIPDAATVEREWAEKAAGAAVALAEKNGIAAETVICHGSPGPEICALARERKPRMIVVGSRGWGALGGAVFGSVSAYVLHRAPCPVLVVGAEARTAEAEDAERSRAVAAD